MAILSSPADSYGEVSRVLIAWGLNFIASLAGLFISLYLLISHDDLNSNFITPIELSNNLNTVSLSSNNWFISTFRSITYVPLCTCFSPCSMPHGTCCSWACPCFCIIWGRIWGGTTSCISSRIKSIGRVSSSWRISSSGRAPTMAFSLPLI